MECANLIGRPKWEASSRHREEWLQSQEAGRAVLVSQCGGGHASQRTHRGRPAMPSAEGHMGRMQKVYRTWGTMPTVVWIRS